MSSLLITHGQVFTLGHQNELIPDGAIYVEGDTIAEVGATAALVPKYPAAERLDAAGVPSVSVTTGAACHLDAEMVHRALHHVPLRGLHCLFIENVGSLACPAAWDLGQTAGVVALSVTEGEDKPLKYPGVFEKADLVLLTKIDLLPHLEVRVERILESLSKVMPRPVMFPVSAQTGEGIFRWTQWLGERRPGQAVLEASRARPLPPPPGGAP